MLFNFLIGSQTTTVWHQSQIQWCDDSSFCVWLAHILKARLKISSVNSVNTSCLINQVTVDSLKRAFVEFGSVIYTNNFLEKHITRTGSDARHLQVLAASSFNSSYTVIQLQYAQTIFWFFCHFTGISEMDSFGLLLWSMSFQEEKSRVCWRVSLMSRPNSPTWAPLHWLFKPSVENNWNKAIWEF